MNIKLKNITKSYDGQIVLNNFSYEFLDGKAYLITGKSGIGKTTLLNILLSLCEVDAGEIENNNTFSVSFQQQRLLEHYDVYKNIELFADNKDEKHLKKLITQLLEEDLINKEVCLLSGGQRQRVEIIRALAAKSDAVILDEPFNGLDEENIKKMLEFIFQHLDSRLLIIASHKYDLLTNYNFEVINL